MGDSRVMTTGICQVRADQVPFRFCVMVPAGRGRCFVMRRSVHLCVFPIPFSAQIRMGILSLVIWVQISSLVLTVGRSLLRWAKEPEFRSVQNRSKQLIAWISIE
jgi:hypothetical protein